MIDRLEALHNKGFLHRDLKPDNILFDPNKGFEEVYLIDFGLSLDLEGREAKFAIRENFYKFRGNLLFSSIYRLNNSVPSYRDDLISLVYTLVYFLTLDVPYDSHKLGGSIDADAIIEEKSKETEETIILSKP